ncbi:hypothetical protein JOE65_000220 [Arthrobacter roseus]|nr:hypothetical protein [Arthrobacter roseus]
MATDAPPGLTTVFGGNGHAGSGPLYQLVALELGERGHDGEHGAAHRPRGADAFRDAAEVHTPVFQVIDESQKLAGVAPQPVQLPDDDLIAVAQMVEHVVQFRPTGPRSAF